MTDPTPAPDGLRQQCADALEPAITAALNRLLRTKGYDPDDPSVDHARTDRETAEVVGAVIPAVMAVRDRELEGLRDERDLHLAAFWQAVKQRDRALAQSAIDRPAADFAEAALARVRKAVAERLAEVGEVEAERGRTSAWGDAVTNTCARITDALRPQPEPQGTGAAGAKVPAQCKFCGRKCVCFRHKGGPRGRLFRLWRMSA